MDLTLRQPALLAVFALRVHQVGNLSDVPLADLEIQQAYKQQIALDPVGADASAVSDQQMIARSDAPQAFSVPLARVEILNLLFAQMDSIALKDRHSLLNVLPVDSALWVHQVSKPRIGWSGNGS
jgi:hypothetical protein